MKASTSEFLAKSVPKCRYFSLPCGCRFGDKCKYSHQEDTTSAKQVENVATESSSHYNVDTVLPIPEEVKASESITERNVSGPEEPETEDFSIREKSDRPQKKSRTFCRYFMKGGFCREGSNCRFLHPWNLVKYRKNNQKGDQVVTSKKPPTEQQPSPTLVNDGKRNFRTRRPPVPKPGKEIVIEKLSELSEESMKYLQNVEIEQLKKRFLKEDLEITQQESGVVCKIKVKPTDPDWPYDVTEIQLIVAFPANYPKKIFHAELSYDGTFPENFTMYVNNAIAKHLDEHDAAQQLRDTADLLFRPFLRWLDRNLENLFTKALKQVKFDVEAKSAGMEFIAFDTQESSAENTVQKATEKLNLASNEDTEATKAEYEESDLNEDLVPVDESNDDEVGHGEVVIETAEQDNTSMFGMIEAKKHGTAKKGTEVRLRGLELHENTATVRIMSLTFTVQCSRCKNRDEMPNVKENQQVVLTCSKCSNAQSIMITSLEVVHQHSATVAFINPQGCSPLDLILSECQTLLGCLNCSKETSVKGIHYGSTRNVWCHHCHQKLDVKVDSARFHQLQPATTTDTSFLTVQVKKNAKNKQPLIKGGQPLPDNGTCKHYKKSFRWMRFPCCGKCYPCDRCHDENEDHEMELANRMICGFCAKEQSFSQKGCISCKSFVTAMRTSHWEGGKGCRNKVKMSRGDDRKYSDQNKTVSRHAVKVDGQKKKK